MTLSEYLAHGEGVIFARKVGISTKTLSHYCTGKSKPRFDIACRISRATRGQVSIEELMNPRGDVEIEEDLFSPWVRFRQSDPVPTEDGVHQAYLRLAGGGDAA